MSGFFLPGQKVSGLTLPRPGTDVALHGTSDARFRCLACQLGRQDTGDGVISETLLKKVRWWFQILFYFHPYLGKIPILTNIFQMG